MVMLRAGDGVELDLTSPLFEDVLGDLEYEMDFLKDMGLVPDKVYTVTKVLKEIDEDGNYTLVELAGVELAWGHSRFKLAAPLSLENE